MTGKRNLFLGLLIGLVLGGALPAFLSFHGWTSAQGSRTVQLRQGWNQLVWTGDSQAIDTALAAVAANMPIAYGWQGDTQTFSRYVPGKAEVSTMSEVAKDSAYWLLMTREVAFSFPTADGQQCPKPTPCPTNTPCPSCGDWQSVAEECQEDYGQCIGALTECTNEFGECTSSLGCWRGCHPELGRCWSDCNSSLGSCWSDCNSDLASCWSDCNSGLELCLLLASTLADVDFCLSIWDCSYCSDIFDCSYCDGIWDCLYCDEIWDCLYCDEIPES